MKSMKNKLIKGMGIALLSFLSISQAYALTIKDEAARDQYSDNFISVKIFAPTQNALNTRHSGNSCAGNLGVRLMHMYIFDRPDSGYAGNFSTGISGDRPDQYVCIEFLDHRAGHDNVWYTNPIKDVPECILTVTAINPGKGTANATPACEYVQGAQ